MSRVDGEIGNQQRMQHAAAWALYFVLVAMGLYVGLGIWREALLILV